MAEGLVQGGPYGGSFSYAANSTVTVTGNNFTTDVGARGQSIFTTNRLQVMLYDKLAHAVLNREYPMGWTFTQY